MPIVRFPDTVALESCCFGFIIKEKAQSISFLYDKNPFRVDILLHFLLLSLNYLRRSDYRTHKFIWLPVWKSKNMHNLSACVDWGHCAIQSKDAKANDIFTKHLLWRPLAPKIDPFVEAELSWFSHRPEVPASLLATRLPVHDLSGIPLSHSSCFENRACYCTLNA